MKNKLTETKFKSALGVARHLISPRTFGSALLGLVLMNGSAWAAPSAIEGIVKDPKGQVISGANLRIEAAGGSSWSKVIKTDAKGHYAYNGLEVGTYRVSLLVNGSVKASINNVKTKLGDPTKLNFDLKATTSSQASAPAKKKATHMVYVPEETGSHIGGRWVEVDDNGAADTAGRDNLKKVNGNALRQIQSNSSTVLPKAGSGN
jgi:hypothetical protein